MKVLRLKKSNLRDGLHGGRYLKGCLRNKSKDQSM
jgi:hypothetical protein